MKIWYYIAYFFMMWFCGVQAFGASSLTAELYSTEEEAKSLGHIIFEESPGGVMIKPNLTGLPPGPHGFHIHANPSCANHGAAAGPHYDPTHKNTHLGPYRDGHLGDLPVLYVNAEGEAHNPLLAPHLMLKQLKNHSVIIHLTGDNYSDSPPNGGGGQRIACGIIKE